MAVAVGAADAEVDAWHSAVYDLVVYKAERHIFILVSYTLNTVVMSKSLEVWEEELTSKNEDTARIYRKAMKTFLDYTGWDHDTLFNTHRVARRSEDPRDWHKVSRQLKACMKEHIEKDRYSTSHAYQIQKAVASFLSANGLDFKMNGSKPFSLEYMGQNVIDADGIRQLLEATADPRTRALIMVAKDSGLRVSDIIKLDVGDVRKAVESGEEFVLIDLRQKKGGRAAKPILGSEALDAVRKWLKKRPNGYADDSPLFTKIEGEGKYDERVSNDTASNVICRLARKVGLKKVSIHSFRKYHTTFCTLGKIPETWVAIIQGRKIRDSRDTYMKPTDAMLIKAYAEAYDNLRVYKAEDVERAKLQKQVESLTAEIERVESGRSSEMEALKDQAQAQIDNFVKMELPKMMEDSRKRILEVVEKQMEKRNEEIAELRRAYFDKVGEDLEAHTTIREVGKVKIRAPPNKSEEG